MKRNPLYLRSGGLLGEIMPGASPYFVCCLCSLLFGIEGPAAVVLSDNDFEANEWSVTSRAGPNTQPMSASGTQSVDGGNGGGYRLVSHTVTPAGSGFAYGWAWHLNTEQTHDPSSNPILSLGHLSEHRRFSSTTGEGATTYIVVQQDGNVYFSGANQVTIALGWVSFSETGLTAMDFFRLKQDGSGTEAVHPNFSDTGSELAFGVGFSNTPIGDGFSMSHGIDNWSVSLDVIPEASVICLAGLSVFGLALRRRRTA